MRAVLLPMLVAIAGCYAGVGPVLAVRTTGDVALGVEGNFGVAGIGPEGGAMLLVHSHEAAGAGSAQPASGNVSGYVAVTGTYLWSPRGEDPYASSFSTGGQAQLGIAWGQVGTGLLVGVGPEIGTALTRDDCSGGMSVDVRVGVRGFGQVAELYVAPTIGAVDPFCL